MAFKKHRKKPAWMRTRDNPSKPIEVIDIRYRAGGGYQHTHLRPNQDSNDLDVEIAQFDVYVDGVYKGTFDNSPRGLIDFVEAMR